MKNALRLFHRWPWSFALLLCVILLIINLVVLPSSAAPARWSSTLATLAPLVLIAFASTPAILSGGIDIAVGPLATLVNCVFVAILIPAGLGQWWAAIPILLLLGAGVGALNGVLVAIVRLNPVVASLGMMFLVIGITLSVAQNPVQAPPNWTDILGGSIGIFPGAIITMGVAALIWFLLRRTAFVNNLLATGESDISAYGSGVNIAGVRILAYTLDGIFAGIGGIALSAVLHSSQSSLATLYALLGLAAAILGGTTLGGGRGGLLGTFFGALVIYLLQQLLTATGVQPNLLQFSYGLVLVVAVLLGATLFSPRSTKARS